MVNSNTEIYKEYITYNVIHPLERMMGRSQWQEYMPYSSKDYRVSKDSVYRSVLHELMVTYYEKYLFGDIRLCKANMESIRLRMKDIIADDDLFGQWASDYMDDHGLLSGHKANPALSVDFFGNKEQANNINKGRPSKEQSMSKAWQEVLPLLDAYVPQRPKKA